jgi:hypothetical protein
VRDNGHVTRATARTAGLPDPLVLDGSWRFELDGLNGFVLDRWEASPEREGSPGTSIDDADADGWAVLGRGAWSFQLDAEPAREYPIPVWFRVPFDVDVVPSRIELVVDGFDGSDHAVYLNGSPITAAPLRASFDAQMRSLDVTPAVREGRNELAIRLIVEGPTGGIVDRIKLMGAFSLEGDAASGYRIAAPREELPPEPWTSHGAPHLSGTATYRRTFELPDGFSGHRLFLEVDTVDDVIEVTVNGQLAGVRLWDPYEFEVTDLVTSGSNEVAIAATNTLANLLDGVDRRSGLTGPPRLLARAAFEFDLAGAEAAEAVEARGEASDG